MTNIKELIDKIHNALYGVEVRSAIIKSFAFIDTKINWVIILLALQGLAIVLSSTAIVLALQ